MKTLFSKYMLKKDFLIYPLLLTFLVLINESLFAQNLQTAYNFWVKPGTDLWNRLDNEQKRIAALQIPDSILRNMSDDAYVETIINFPLFGYYTAFENNKIGFDVMVTRFNLFDKMCEKKNVGKLLLEAYKDADMHGFNKYNNKYRSELWTIKLNYLEILLSQKNIINTLDDLDKNELLKVALYKLISKQKNPMFSSYNGIEPTLSIMASSLTNLNALEKTSNEKKTKINEFLKTTYLKEPDVINYIISTTEEYLKNR